MLTGYGFSGGCSPSAAGAHHRIEDTSRRWQGGDGGGACGLGGMDRTNNGGHIVEEGSQWTMEGKGASSSEKGMDKGHGKRQRLRMASDIGGGEPWLLLVMSGHTPIILLPFINSNLFNKNDLLEMKLPNSLHV